MAVGLLPRVSLRLRISGYRPTRQWLDDRLDAPVASTDAGAPANRAGRGDAGEAVSVGLELAFLVRLVARFVPDSTCLRKALVLRHLLGRRAIPAVIKFGVRRQPEGSDLAFHAWVEVDDEVVSEPAEKIADFQVLIDEPPASSSY